MNKIKLFTLLFLLFSVLDILGILFRIPELIYLFKPLILPSLLVLFLVSVEKINKMYLLALFFSFLGDVFLLFAGEFYFIAGLVSFLIAHILFISLVLGRIERVSFLKFMSAFVPFLIVLVIFMYVLKSSLGAMLIPVIIYATTIMLFGTVSLIYYREEKSNKALFMLAGALVFIVSDAILAINKFYHAAHVLEIMVMVTYVIAQYLIYRSMIRKEVKTLKI